jgi:hypothetical protein
MQQEYLQTRTQSKYRLFQQLDETIDCIISAFSVLAKEHYIHRNNTVYAQLHFTICKEIYVGLKLENEHWYEHVPKSI